MGLKYFQDEGNKEDFISKLNNNPKLIDYYLFGLHTFNSHILVNFVSTTRSPQIAYSHKSDLIILTWLMNGRKHLCMSKERLMGEKEAIAELGIPILNDSFYPNEDEYAMKGFIPPHYIFGVIDVNDNALILNPELLTVKGIQEM